MQSVIIVIHLMIVVAMIGVVLLQKSEGGGLGIGSTGGFMSSRGTANVLTRATAVLAGLHRSPTSILGPGGTPASAPSPPLSPGGGLLDQLRQQEGAPPAPPAPGAPSAPPP